MNYLPDIPDIDADFSESKPDEHEDAIRQKHEPFLTRLEALAVCAIATNHWADFYAHVVNFQNEHDLYGEAFISDGAVNADEMTTPSVDPNPTTQNESKGA